MQKKILALTLALALILSFSFSAAATQDQIIKENNLVFKKDFNIAVTANASLKNAKYNHSLAFNVSDTSLQNWFLEFDFAGELKSFSNVSEIERTQNPDGTWHYVLKQRWGQNKFSVQLINPNNSRQISNILFYQDATRDLKTTVIKPWQVGASFKAGDLIHFNTKYYKVRLTHTVTAPNWVPTNQTALYFNYKLVTKPVFTEIQYRQ